MVRPKTYREWDRRRRLPVITATAVMTAATVTACGNTALDLWICGECEGPVYRWSSLGNETKP